MSRTWKNSTPPLCVKCCNHSVCRFVSAPGKGCDLRTQGVRKELVEYRIANVEYRSGISPSLFAIRHSLFDIFVTCGRAEASAASRPPRYRISAVASQPARAPQPARDLT